MEILTPVAERLLKSFFAGAPGEASYSLAGGTALALADFQHRRSDDLDFFSREPGAVERFARAIRAWGIEQGFVVEVDPGFDTKYQARYRFGLGEEVVKVDLCLDSPPFLGEPRARSGVRYDARRNLFASKLAAFFGRGEPKDAVDAYFIFTSGEDPSGLVADALEKEVGRDFDSVARGLALYEPLDLPESFLRSYMIKPVSRAEMKACFREVATAIRSA
jgi:predicted nucleotidyltransferase component of viral defense system